MEDFERFPSGADFMSAMVQGWLQKLGLRQNIDIQQELTSVDSADEVMIFDASETGPVKTKKATVSNLAAAIGGGGLVELIAPTSFPSANLLSITDLPQTYGALLLVVSGLSFDTASRAILANISSDNGATFSVNGFYGTVILNASVFAVTNNAAGLSSNAQAAGDTISMIVEITGYQAGSFTKVSSVGFDQSGVAFSGETAYLANTLKTDAVRLIMNLAGNFDAGTYALYGVT